MTSFSGIDFINAQIENKKEFWDRIEDFYYGIEENVRMEDEKNVIHTIPFCALV